MCSFPGNQQRWCGKELNNSGKPQRFSPWMVPERQQEESTLLRYESTSDRLPAKGVSFQTNAFFTGLPNTFFLCTPTGCDFELQFDGKLDKNWQCNLYIIYSSLPFISNKFYCSLGQQQVVMQKSSVVKKKNSLIANLTLTSHVPHCKERITHLPFYQISNSTCSWESRNAITGKSESMHQRTWPQVKSLSSAIERVSLGQCPL